MTRFKSALFATSLVAGLTVGLTAAMAQRPAPAYDPAQLPETKGKVTQYLLNPRGMVDGLLLDSGTEVHLNPMLGTELVYAVRPGDAVTVHGLKARAVSMVMAMSVTNDATGKTVILSPRQQGPDGGHGMKGPMGREHEAMKHGGMQQGTGLELSGKVKTALHNPRGETDGVLLEDGSQVRLPPQEAKRLADQIKPGSTITVRGMGTENLLGKVVAARQIGPDATHLVDVRGPQGMPDHARPGRGRPQAPADTAPVPAPK
jgi:hypothetical protein